MQQNPNITHAAVGIIQRADGMVLLGERPAGKPWAGWWEFPGGKIEDGETAEHALKTRASRRVRHHRHATLPVAHAQF